MWTSPNASEDYYEGYNDYQNGVRLTGSEYTAESKGYRDGYNAAERAHAEAVEAGERRDAREARRRRTKERSDG